MRGLLQAADSYATVLKLLILIRNLSSTSAHVISSASILFKCMLLCIFIFACQLPIPCRAAQRSSKPRSYRKLALKWHPDKNKDNPVSYRHELRQLSEGVQKKHVSII